MPVSLKKFISNSARVTLDFGDGDLLNVDYYPGRISERTFAQLQQFAQMAEASGQGSIDSLTGGFGALNAVMAEIIQTWDLLADDDIPVPLTKDSLAEVPFMIRIEVAKAVMQDFRPEAVATQKAR